MAKIKSNTDLEQSKILAKILPLESADMYYSKYNTIHANTLYSSRDRQYFHIHEYTPCWSLAALISVVPNGIVMNKDCQNGKYHFSFAQIGTYVKADNPVDACYEMILKLKEK